MSKIHIKSKFDVCFIQKCFIINLLRKMEQEIEQQKMEFSSMTHSSYQVVFSKNFELLKVKYRKLMTPNLEVDLFNALYVYESHFSFFEEM